MCSCFIQHHIPHSSTHDYDRYDPKPNTTSHRHPRHEDTQARTTHCLTRQWRQATKYAKSPGSLNTHLHTHCSLDINLGTTGGDQFLYYLLVRSLIVCCWCMAHGVVDRCLQAQATSASHASHTVSSQFHFVHCSRLLRLSILKSSCLSTTQ